MSIKVISSFLLNKPLEVKVRGWNIKYMSFGMEEHKGKPPIVIIGGAFQRFSSFSQDVRFLVEHYPVLIVELPGQGSNDQDAELLGFEDLAVILKNFISLLGIERITPLALSYGSAIGLNFAHMFPERTFKLIMGGTTLELRPSVRYLLEESLDALDRKDLDSFNAGVVLNLMNYSRRSQLPHGEMLAKHLYKGISKLTDRDRVKYQQNTKRLLDLKNIKKEAQCETLVIAGEFDNFTTPFECFKVAKECEKSVFVIVRGADHLAPYQKKSVVNEMFLEFLDGKRFEKTSEYFPFRKNSFAPDSRQIDDRFEVNTQAFLRSDDGRCYPVYLKNINSTGCCVETGFLDDSFSSSKKYWLESESIGMRLPLIIFKNQAFKSHAVFIRDNFDRFKKLEHFVNRVSEVQRAA